MVGKKEGYTQEATEESFNLFLDAFFQNVFCVFLDKGIFILIGNRNISSTLNKVKTLNNFSFFVIKLNIEVEVESF